MTAEIRQLLNEFADAILRHEIEREEMTDNNYREVRNRIVNTYTVMIERIK
jgi:hypothetical protein